MARHRMQMFSLALFVLGAITVAYADDPAAAAGATPQAAPSGTQMGHSPADGKAMRMMKAAPAAPGKPDASATMMSNMKDMQDQMARIHSATDPEERSKLLDEHMKTMHDTMKLMMGKDGGCPMMVGDGQGGKPAGTMGKGSMMQMMMDQMMEHQDMMQAPGK